MCLAAAEALAAPAFPLAPDAQHDAQPLESGTDIDELDDERLPPSRLRADLLADTPLHSRRGHGCRGDDQPVLNSSAVDRLLRPLRS